MWANQESVPPSTASKVDWNADTGHVSCSSTAVASSQVLTAKQKSLLGANIPWAAGSVISALWHDTGFGTVRKLHTVVRPNWSSSTASGVNRWDTSAQYVLRIETLKTGCHLQPGLLYRLILGCAVSIAKKDFSSCAGAKRGNICLKEIRFFLYFFHSVLNSTWYFHVQPSRHILSYCYENLHNWTPEIISSDGLQNYSMNSESASKALPGLPTPALPQCFSSCPWKQSPEKFCTQSTRSVSWMRADFGSILLTPLSTSRELLPWLLLCSAAFLY